MSEEQRQELEERVADLERALLAIVHGSTSIPAELLGTDDARGIVKHLASKA